MKRIVVGVDGSDISRAAAEFAAGLARATGADQACIRDLGLVISAATTSPGRETWWRQRAR